MELEEAKKEEAGYYEGDNHGGRYDEGVYIDEDQDDGLAELQLGDFSVPQNDDFNLFGPQS
tara:strand:+ start:472 stop:654 length:183 start_codon:yes stop_codon:yes gene_type:complete